MAALKKNHLSPKSDANKLPFKQPKNLVTTPNNPDNRNLFKSPGNRPLNRNDSQQEKSGKRIQSFGGKKLIGGRFLEDGDAISKKSGGESTGNFTGSPQIFPKIAKVARFPGLDVSEN